MAESEKQSFVLYFDAYPSVEELPPDQRGELFSALYQYAIDAAAGTGSLDTVLSPPSGHGSGGPDGLRLHGRCIQRDTDKWRAKHQRYREAALRRHREAGGKTAGDDAWRYVEDPARPVPGNEKAPRMGSFSVRRWEIEVLVSGSAGRV